jgi:hypothetical protein
MANALPGLDLNLDQDILPLKCKYFDLSQEKSPINVPVLTSYLNIYANVNKSDAEFHKEGFLKGVYVSGLLEKEFRMMFKIYFLYVCVRNFYCKKIIMSWKLVGLLVHLRF